MTHHEEKTRNKNRGELHLHFTLWPLSHAQKTPEVHCFAKTKNPLINELSMV